MVANYPNPNKARKRRALELEKRRQAAETNRKRRFAKMNPDTMRVCTRCGRFFDAPGRLCGGCSVQEPDHGSTSVKAVSGGLPTLGKGRK